MPPRARLLLCCGPMMRRTLVAASLALSAALALAGSTPEVPPTPAVLQASDAEVKKCTDDLEKAFTEKDDELTAKALEEIETLRHDGFVPYIRRGLKSNAPAVIAASYRAAAAHEIKDIEKDVRKRLKLKPPKPGDKGAPDNTGLAGEVGSAAIDYLNRMGLAGDEGVILEEYLIPLTTATMGDERRVKASWAQDLMRASIHYLGRNKYKLAVPHLIELVAEPQPKPIAAGKPDTNPAPPYWQARVKLWHASEGWVRWALKEITGQEFRSPREWEAWLKENRKDYK